jgi:hypothetical protein
MGASAMPLLLLPGTLAMVVGKGAQGGAAICGDISAAS